MTGLVEPGEGIPAGEGKLINIITDIAPSAVPQVIPIYNNQTSESFYWNLSLFVNTTVIDGQLEITEEQPEEPELVITSIRGGLGLEIIVENHGLIDATEIKVNITVSGGFWILKRNFEEKIDTLSPDGDQFVVRKIIIGFGLGILKNRPKIQISATCAEDKPVETTIEVRALIVFLLILDQ